MSLSIGASSRMPRADTVALMTPHACEGLVAEQQSFWRSKQPRALGALHHRARVAQQRPSNSTGANSGRKAAAGRGYDRSRCAGSSGVEEHRVAGPMSIAARLAFIRVWGAIDFPARGTFLRHDPRAVAPQEQLLLPVGR